MPPSARSNPRQARPAVRRYDVFRDSPLRPLSPAGLTLLLVAVGLVWRSARYALAFPIWGDEAFVATDFILRDFAGLARPLTWGQIVPLGYLWATEAVSRVAGYSEWALRLVAFLAGLASLLLFWRFAQQLFTRRAAMLAVGFLAVAYYPIRHATEVKPYATDLLLALAVLMLAWRAHQAPRDTRRWLVLLPVAALAPWCSYPVIFVLAAAGVLLLPDAWRQRRATPRPLILVLAFGALSIGSFVAMYLLFGRPQAHSAAGIGEIDMWAKTFPPVSEPWKLPIWVVYIHTGNMLAYPHGGDAGGSAATLILVVCGAVALWRRGRRDLLWLLLGPLAFALLAAALHKYPYGGSARTTLYMAPAFCLLAPCGLLASLRWGGLRAARLNVVTKCVAVGLAVFGVVMVGRDFAEPYKNDAVRVSREIVRQLATEAAPDERWVIFNSPEPVDYAPWLGDWKGTGGQFFFDVLRFGPPDLRWSPPPGQAGAGAPGRVLLLAYRGVKVEFPQAQFDAYRAALQRDFAAPPDCSAFPIKERDGRVEAVEACLFRP